MRVVKLRITICPRVMAFVLVRRGLYVINLAAEPDANVIQLDFLP